MQRCGGLAACLEPLLLLLLLLALLLLLLLLPADMEECGVWCKPHCDAAVAVVLYQRFNPPKWHTTRC
jgi:hypothetical protein